MQIGESGEQLRVFVSHSLQDVVFCRELKRVLNEVNVDVFLDDSGLRAGVLWEKLSSEIRDRPVFIVVLSPDALISESVKREVDTASAYFDAKRTILPVIVRAIDEKLIWPQIKQFLYIKSDNATELIEKVFDLLGLSNMTSAADAYEERSITELIELAKQAISFAQYGNAVQILDVASVREPNNEAVHLLYAAMSVDTGNWARAQKEAQQVIDNNPQNGLAFFYLGHALVRRGLYQEAITSFTNGLKYNTDNLAAWDYLGYAYLQIDQAKEALDAFNQALQIDEADGDAKQGRQIARDRLGTVDTSRSVKRSGDSSSNRFPRLSNKRFERDIYQPQRTVVPFSVKVIDSKNSENVTQAILQTASESGREMSVQNDEATVADYIDILLDFINEQIFIHPEDSELKRTKALLLADEEQYDKALEINDDLIAFEGADDDNWLNRGIILGKAERYEEAVVAVQEVTARHPQNRDGWLSLANLYNSQKLYDNALAVLEQGLSFIAQDLSLLLAKLSVLIDLGHFEAALTIAESVISLYPQDPVGFINKALLLHDMHRYEEALTNYRQADQLDSNFKQLHVYEGQALIALERVDEALQQYNLFLEQYPDDVSALIEKASALLYLKHYEEALNLYDRIIEFDNQNAFVWNDRGAALSSLGRYEEALQSVEWAMQLDLNQAFIFRNHAEISLQLGNKEAALADYDRVIALDSTNEITWAYKADVLATMNNVDEAIHVCLEGLQINARSLILIGLLGDLYVRASNYKQAIITYDQYLQYDPNSAGTYLAKGDVLFFNLEEYAQAREAYAKVLDLEPDNIQALVSLGNALLSLEMNEAARDAYNEVLKIVPNNKEALNGKGLSLQALEQYDEAQIAFRQAIARDSQFTLAIINLANLLYYSLRQLVDADDVYSQALKIEPENSTILYTKASVLLEMEQLDDALVTVKLALDIDARYVDAWTLKGVILTEMGQRSEALEAFEQSSIINQSINAASEIEKTQSLLEMEWIQSALVYTLVSLQRFNEALAIADQALAMIPESVSVLLARSGALRKMKLPQGALVFAQQALKGEGDKGNVYNELAYVYRDLGQIPLAAQYVDQAIAQNPRLAAYRDTHGDVLMVLGDTDGALNDYRMAVAMEPTKAVTWSNIGKVFQSKREYVIALEYYNKALILNPYLSEGWYNKGYILMLQGQYTEAIEALQQAVKLDSLRDYWWYILGYVYVSTERYSDALRAFARVLDLNPQMMLAITERNAVLGKIHRLVAHE